MKGSPKMFYQSQTNKLYYRYISLLAVIILGVVSILGSGGGGDGGVSTPPTITTVSPAQGSDSALVTALVTAQFSIDMDPGSITDPNNFTVVAANISAVNASSITYDAGSDIVTFTPDADLTSNVQYIATISSAVQDINGNNPLSSDYVWSFNIAPTLVPASLNSNKVFGNNASFTSDVDATGRYIVIASDANNLVPNISNNGQIQIYRKDSQTGVVEMVSTDSTGLVAALGFDCESPRISDDGRYVVFASAATNFGTAGGISQIYLKDMDTNTLTLVSHRNNSTDPGDQNSFQPDISANGKYIVFASRATNLVSSDTNGEDDIFFVDMDTPTIVELISVTGSTQANGTSSKPAVSATGQFVAFDSIATNLDVSSNGLSQIYRRDRTAPATVIVSINNGGSDGGNNGSEFPDISADGNLITFQSTATDLLASPTSTQSQIFLRDISSNTTTQVSISGSTEGNNNSSLPSISADGNYIAFESLATNLATSTNNGVSHVFVKNITNGTIEPLSIDDPGGANPVQGNDASGEPAISSNGRYISFSSLATNFDTNDTNGLSDIYRAHNAALP
jgi:hypothetical protein